MPVKSGLRPFASRVAVTSVLASAVGLLGGCGDNRLGDGLTVEDGALNGEVAVYQADDPERGVSERQYVLRAPNGDERRLHFDQDPGLQPGTRIKLWGTELAGGLEVKTFKTLPKPEPSFVERVTAPLKEGMTFAAKRLAFVIVDIGGGVGTWTLDRAQAELTGPSTSTTDPPTRNYYMEASYGTQDLDGRAFVMSYPMSSCSNTDTVNMAKSLKPMVMQMGGGRFDHYLWFFGSKLSACSWSGLGEVGTPDAPTDDTWYNNSASCVVMIQEPGHNFGMQHSSSMRCSGTAIADDPNGGTCTHSEYGDRFDPMGGGCRHMNGWQKSYNGWLQGCNVVQARQSGTFTLVPMELACDGVQMLQIPMPKTRMFKRSGGGGQDTNESLTHYYLELRTPKGIDTGMATSVLVHVSGPLRGRTQKAVHTWILDMEPSSTNSFEGMTAGKSFTDPAGGLTFTVMELDASHATINVEMTAQGGGPVCMDGTTPFTAPGPGIESCNATPTTPGGGGASGATGGAGMGGAAGTGGRPATGGANGGGTGGATGTGGRGGTGGTIINPGTGGSGTGTGGRPATGGTPGSGGASTGGAGIPATGGASASGGATGSGGDTGTGNGGSGPGGVVVGPGVTGGEVTGGCTCSTTGSTSSRGGALTFGALLMLGAIRKRRRR